MICRVISEKEKIISKQLCYSLFVFCKKQKQNNNNNNPKIPQSCAVLRCAVHGVQKPDSYLKVYIDVIRGCTKPLEIYIYVFTACDPVFYCLIINSKNH